MPSTTADQPFQFIDPLADPAIGDYGAIGNCRTLALVSRFGAIDWWCLPDFSGPSVFASLLDRRRGGRFALTPRDVVSVHQAYLDCTNVLLTRFECRDGTLELHDFMTLGSNDATPRDDSAVPQRIVRIARCTAGRVELQVLYQPRPDYARADVTISPRGDGRWRCSAGGLELALSTSMTLQQIDAGTLGACVTLASGERHAAVLQVPAPTAAPAQPLHADADEELARTVAWWRECCAQSIYEGPYRDAVLRSFLTLKLLTHAPTGAVVAAGTTSLPEGDTGERNWDYRFCWLRDTSLVLQAFVDLGFVAESNAFLGWLLHATQRTRPMLQPLYDVHGGSSLEELTLDSLSGYHGIGPVRIGNAASRQQQHDIFGELLLTASDFVGRGGSLDDNEKAMLGRLVEVVCEIWREPDHGIWEIRLPPRHNTHSKLMCWAALDRALALHERIGLPLDKARVTGERDAVRADIETHGWNAAVNSYVGYYGSECADASLLLMPRLGFVDARHPRMCGTLDHIMAQLGVDDGLLYRYPPGAGYDGVGGCENLFAICSFWCVDCLARQGRLEEARHLYERLLELRNHAGLYAEEFSVHDCRALGNFPQAFSHIGAITAAMAIAGATPRAA
jgi:GH15 family glucan-1,4-alpha-glucosidase